MEEKLRQVNSKCKKVVLYGPESSGKTTLAIELSNYYSVKKASKHAIYITVSIAWGPHSDPFGFPM